MYSNVSTPDSTISNEDRTKRVVELNQSVCSYVEHGWMGRFIEGIELSKQYNVKPLLGTEAYFVKDRLQKDSTNAHIILLAKNENGRKAINLALSEANETGFYYKPRIDLDILLKMPKNDVWVTSACLGGVWKYPDYENLIIQIHNHFQNNFFLEVQPHNVDKQKLINKEVLRLSKKHNIKIIAGMDSHMIYPEQAKERDDYLLSRGITYPDEDNWYLDFPSYQEAINRFKIQGILSKHETYLALENTNIFESVEEYNSVIFNDTKIKLPTLYPDLSQEERNKKFENLIWSKWQTEKTNIPKEQHKKYEEEISKEVSTIVETNMSDYFLLDYEIIKKGIEKGGHITLTSRGCFTKDAKIFTNNGLKDICDVKKGDSVISQDGKFHPVFDVLKYKISEPLINIKYIYGGKNKHNVCTFDHRIFIHRNGKNEWVEAKEIKKGDFVCLPIYQNEILCSSIIDLNEYNYFGFKYDEEYIYEKNSNVGKDYDYSPSSLAKEFGVGKSLFENYANGKENCFSRKKWIEQKFLNNTPFRNQQEYIEYIENHRTIKIKRFIKNDKNFNIFLGLMYGDGFTVSKNRSQIALAIGTNANKNIINRKYFLDIINNIGCPTYEYKSKNRQLIQIYATSIVLRSFFEKEIFISKKEKNKNFNFKLLNQSKENLRGIWEGLMFSDGHFSGKENVIDSFDNTSSSIISAFKILNSCVGESPDSLNIRESYNTKEGYVCKKSYKLQLHKKALNRVKKYEECKKDDSFWYFPIKNIEIINNEKKETEVYDLSVLGNHSYVINNMLVHNSAPSFYISKLLGFTTIDRISSKVKLFPERFITKERILEAGSLPDIDFNLSDPQIFLEAQKEIMGEGHSYPMITFGTMKSSGAWKMYARANNISFEIANLISDQIKQYEESLKYADEEEKENVSIYNFIEEKYRNIYDGSLKYLNLVNSISIHPCASLIMNENLKEEFGLIRIKSSASNSDNLCVNCDGLFAEKYKMLKNDLLKVDVVDLIYKTYEKINIKPHTIPELIDICDKNEKVWDVYKNGWTIGINQFEKSVTTQKAIRYAPKNISELSAFISAIRPGFQSEYHTFEQRKPFSFGVETLDNIIQTDEFPYSFMLYQENTMAVLSYAGIPIDETYSIIKNIAKKRYEKVVSVKDQFVKGMTKRLIENEKIKKKDADSVSKKTWQVIEDSARYSFNSSHSYSVAGDSLYGAYLKSHYPIQFYTSFIQIMEDKGNKDRILLSKKEAIEAFNINFPIFQFGQDNTKISYDLDNNAINMSLKSIKGFGNKIAEDMLQLSKLFIIEKNSQYKFLDLLIFSEDNSYISSKFEDLIKIRYFEEFGKNKKLHTFYKEFTSGKNRYSKTHTDKTKEKRISELQKIWNELPNKNYSIQQQIKNELEILNEIQTNFPVNKNYAVALCVDTKYSPKIEFQNLLTGERKTFKINNKIYNEFPINKGDILLFKKVIKKNSMMRNEESKWVKIEDKFDLWLEVYYIVKENDKLLK